MLNKKITELYELSDIDFSSKITEVIHLYIYVHEMFTNTSLSNKVNERHNQSHECHPPTEFVKMRHFLFELLVIKLYALIYDHTSKMKYMFDAVHNNADKYKDKHLDRIAKESTFNYGVDKLITRGKKHIEKGKKLVASGANPMVNLRNRVYAHLGFDAPKEQDMKLSLRVMQKVVIGCIRLHTGVSMIVGEHDNGVRHYLAYSPKIKNSVLCLFNVPKEINEDETRL